MENKKLLVPEQEKEVLSLQHLHWDTDHFYIFMIAHSFYNKWQSAWKTIHSFSKNHALEQLFPIGKVTTFPASRDAFIQLAPSARNLLAVRVFFLFLYYVPKQHSQKPSYRITDFWVLSNHIHNIRIEKFHSVCCWLFLLYTDMGVGSISFYIWIE